RAATGRRIACSRDAASIARLRTDDRIRAHTQARAVAAVCLGAEISVVAGGSGRRSNDRAGAGRRIARAARMAGIGRRRTDDRVPAYAEARAVAGVALRAEVVVVARRSGRRIQRRTGAGRRIARAARVAGIARLCTHDGVRADAETGAVALVALRA